MQWQVVTIQHLNCKQMPTLHQIASVKCHMQPPKSLQNFQLNFSRYFCHHPLPSCYRSINMLCVVGFELGLISFSYANAKVKIRDKVMSTKRKVQDRQIQLPLILFAGYNTVLNLIVSLIKNFTNHLTRNKPINTFA